MAQNSNKVTKTALEDLLDLRFGRKPVTNMSDLQKCFRKTCTNEFPAYTAGTNEPQMYRRNDLNQWAKEARERGDRFFYCEPTNPNEPNGELRLCEPHVTYVLKRHLSEQEFITLFGNNNTNMNCYK